jgi:hypothetical protein
VSLGPRTRKTIVIAIPAGSQTGYRAVTWLFGIGQVEVVPHNQHNAPETDFCLPP